jgi:hypothetical protein
MLAHVTRLSCREPLQGCEEAEAAQVLCSVEEVLPSTPEAHVQGSETYSTAPISFLYRGMETEITLNDKIPQVTTQVSAEVLFSMPTIDTGK